MATSSHSDERSRRLWLAGHWEELWRAVVLPWLHATAQEAWSDWRPTVVLVPSRATGFYIHERVVEAGFPLAAIHFWTPADARMNLQRFFPGIAPTPPREILHVLATLAAEEVLRRDAGNKTAASIAVEPSSFIQAVDQLAGAGWDLAEVAGAPLRAVVRQWRQLLEQNGFQPVQGIDRELISRATQESPRLARALLCGFDGSHWAEWPILQAVVETTAAATVGLIAPKLGWEDMDQAWIGTWEQRFGAAQPCEAIAEEWPRPYAPLQEALFRHDAKRPKLESPVEFHMGRNLRGEAACVVAAVLRCLQETPCERVGIAVPGVSPLAREIASGLERAGIPCDDAFGFTQPGSFEKADWRAWRSWQESPGLESLLALLEFLPLQTLLADFPSASREMIEFTLREAFKEVLLDDMTVLRAWLAATPNDRNRVAVACLDLLEPPPERAAWKVFVARTLETHRRLGWTERAERIAWKASDAGFLAEQEMSRTAFLRWLGEVAISTQKLRGAENNHRYSRVHLLAYAEAEKQLWSRLILTSLNEGVWPPSSNDSGFLNRNELLRLNRSVRRLNVQATREGSQGEGHVSLEPGKGLCLGPLERRLLAESQTLGLLENVSGRLILTARLSEEKSAGQMLAPNEFFSRLYSLQTGRPLGDEEAESLCAKSETQARPLLDRCASTPTTEDISATAQAYATRRDSSADFGEFDFSLREPLSQMPSLSCGEWESALKEPAAVWMKKFLRVSSREEATVENVLLPVRGTWSHRWLAAVGAPRKNLFLPWPSAEEVIEREEKQALDQRARVEKILRQCERSLPIWWISLWNEARFLTRELTAVLAPARERPSFATEYILPKTESDFSEGALPPLRLDGRIDLLLAWTLPTGGELPAELWLIDFKTGRASKPLTTGELLRGGGVQLALYALALRQLGATAVQASLVRPGELVREQMALEKFEVLRENWLELQRMQDSGRFGVHGELRSEYRHAKSLPLATLAIDPEILAEKWTRTHPAWEGVV